MKEKIFDISTFSFRKTFYLIPLSISLCILCNVILSLFFDLSQNEVTKSVNELTNSKGIMYSALIVSFFIPIIEEIVYRGFIFYFIKKYFNYVVAIIISSLLFSFSHTDIPQIIYAFISGIILAFVRYRYNSIIYSIFMHLVMNLTSLTLVSSIVDECDIRSKAFQIFIMAFIFAISFYRIIQLTIVNKMEDI